MIFYLATVPLAIACDIENGLMRTVNQDGISQVHYTNYEPANDNGGKRP